MLAVSPPCESATIYDVERDQARCGYADLRTHRHPLSDATATSTARDESHFTSQEMRNNMRNQRRRSTAAIATLAFGAVLAGAALSAMPATAKIGSDPAGTSKPAAAATAPAFPTFVHLPADQAAHPNTTQGMVVRGRPPQRPRSPVRLRGPDPHTARHRRL